MGKLRYFFVFGLDLVFGVDDVPKLILGYGGGGEIIFLDSILILIFSNISILKI